MSHIVIPELLLKYVDGKCSTEEVDALYGWYDAIGGRSDPFLGMCKEEALMILSWINLKAVFRSSKTPAQKDHILIF